jgi:8-oxo-dGTP diphosphatase
VRVVAAIIESDGEILACRRATHKSLAGKWEFPGGKVEAGETEESALAREILEELGAVITVWQLVETTFSTTNGLSIEMASYLCRLSGERPTQSSDHDKLLWLGRDELQSLDWAELDIPVVEKLRASAN